MLGRLYPDEFCSSARALEIVGERWSLLIVRNAMFGELTRFTELQRSLGIAPNILAKRLNSLVEAGIFESRSDGGGHAEYVLTRKGRELHPIVIALTEWGDRWAAPEGPPVTYTHEECGGQVTLQLACMRCGDHPPDTSVKVEVSERYRDAPRAWAGRRASNRSA